MLKDKKFLLTTILAIIGLIIPFAPKIFDNADRNLTIETIKQTDLSPTNAGLMTNLDVYYSNTKVTEPYLTEIKIINKGKESITKSDFETPIEIELKKDQKIINATVTQLNPKDINPSLLVSQNVISLSPTLFNSEDYITIQILSDHGMPILTPHGRIKNIKAISLTTQKNKKNDYVSIVFFIIISIFFLIPISAATTQILDDMIFRRRVIVLFMIMCLLGAEISIIKLMEELDIDSFWYFAITFIVMIIISYPLGQILNKDKKVDSN